MALTNPVGWDAQVYWKAIQSVHHGYDPYAIGLAGQQAFHDQVHGPKDRLPFTYVYSPMTLPLLRLLGVFPGWLLAALYWPALAGGFLLQLWVGYQMAEEHERRWLALMLPFIALFPGMLADDVILSGNLVYLLNGLIFAAIIPGWKRDRWLWFYLAVLAASICKAPLLSLLAFPILVGRRQWLSASLSGAMGLLLFAVQARLWPNQFLEYMLAIRLQFDWNHDFGFGPAGALGNALFEMGKPFGPAVTILYLTFAGSLITILLLLAHRVRKGKLSRNLWIPIALVGTMLLNPRVKEYDVAAITVPMLLIAWRTLRSALNYFPDERQSSQMSGTKRAMAGEHPEPSLVLAGLGWFVAFNVIAATVEWKLTELGLLLGTLMFGVWSLYRAHHEGQSAATSSSSLIDYPEEDSLGVLAL